jgi:hypothetical protein
LKISTNDLRPSTSDFSLLTFPTLRLEAKQYILLSSSGPDQQFDHR